MTLAPTTQAQVNAWLAKPSLVLLGVCPVCGGWTMFITTESPNASRWVQSCFLAGDLILPTSAQTGWGPMCTQSEVRLEVRTCDR